VTSKAAVAVIGGGFAGLETVFTVRAGRSGRALAFRDQASPEGSRSPWSSA